MGVEPKEEDIPVEISDMPYEVQDAFEIYQLLPARIAEFSGIYLGKDYGNLGFFFDMYHVDESWQKFYFQIILHIDATQVEILEKKRAAREKAAKVK